MDCCRHLGRVASPKHSPDWAAVVWVLGFWLVLFTGALLGGCSVATRDRATVITEEGLNAADRLWDLEYQRKLAECKGSYEAGTPEAEACFGDYYDADAKVNAALQSAVLTLRTYWSARARGDAPSWADVAPQVLKVIDSLPPQARQFFDRVKGLRP